MTPSHTILKHTQLDDLRILQSRGLSVLRMRQALEMLAPDGDVADLQDARARVQVLAQDGAIEYDPANDIVRVPSAVQSIPILRINAVSPTERIRPYRPRRDKVPIKSIKIFLEILALDAAYHGELPVENFMGILLRRLEQKRYGGRRVPTNRGRIRNAIVTLLRNKWLSNSRGRGAYAVTPRGRAHAARLRELLAKVE